MDCGDKSREEEHVSHLHNHSPMQKDEDSVEIAEEERQGIVSDLPSITPEDNREDDQLRRTTSSTSSPFAKRVNFSPTSSPRTQQHVTSLSPSSSSSKNRSNSLKNLISKLSFKNRNNNVDIEKAADFALASSPSSGHGRDRSTWTLANVLAPRSKKTESLPVTPIAHSNPESTHERFAVDPVTSMKKGPLLPIHRSRSVPAFNKDGSLKQPGVFRVIPTPNMTPARNVITDTDVEAGEDVPEEEAVCRICLVEMGEDSEALKLECMCRGELALAHKECAIKWFTIKGNRTCDVCKQEVKNLPVILLRVQSSQANNGAAETEASRERVWQNVPILIIVSMLAYFCFLEQLLLSKMQSGAIAISLPFSCILGLFASITTTSMVKKKYVWTYATVQFLLVVLFAHIFYQLVPMLRKQPVVCILLATFIGFGLTMGGTTGLVQFSKWRRSRRAEETPSSSSQVDTLPVQTTDENMSGS